MKAHLNIAFIAAAFLLSLPVHAVGDSCSECHLHGSLIRESINDSGEPQTLAGFHIKEFKGEGQTSACRRCHGNLQESDKLPHSEACMRCHTRSKAAHGNSRMAFHAEKNHWPSEMAKVSCIDCHKGHIKGNPDIKFLTTNTADVCSKCHEKVFNRKETVPQEGFFPDYGR